MKAFTLSSILRLSESSGLFSLAMLDVDTTLYSLFVYEQASFIPVLTLSKEPVRMKPGLHAFTAA